MTIINTNSISGISSITAQGSNGIEFYESSGVNQRLNITSAGRVNIGQASDVDHTLCVAGTDNATSLTGGHNQGIQLQNKSTTDGTYSQIEWRTSSGGRYARIAGIQDDANGNGGQLAFLTETSGGTTAEALRITSDGNVGINESSPGGLLQVGASSGSHVIITPNTGVDINDGAINLYQATSNASAAPFIISSDVGGTETEQFRVTAGGQLRATGVADVRLTLGSNGTAGTNDSVHVRADGANLLFMNANGGLTKFERNGTETLTLTSDGKLLLPNGSPGIQFGSPDSNGNITSQTLDDYEEGTFTPTLDVTGASGTLSISYSAQVGRYVKVGRIVHFTIDIRLSSWSRGTGTGGVMVKGLPIPPVDSSNYSRSSGFCDLYDWDYSSDASDVPYYSVYQDANQPWINIFKHRKGATSSEVSDPGNSSMMFLSGTYEAGA